MFRARRRRRRLLAIGILFAAVVIAAGVAYAVLKSRTGSIFNSGVAFNSQHAGGKPSAPPDRFVWPYYGYSADHLRYLDANIAPPFHRRWSFQANALLEFPPVIANGVLYQLDDDAVINAVNKETGRLRWTRVLGEHSASTPAIGNGVVYVTVLKRAGARGGLIAALGAGDGHVIWQRYLPSGSESSPLYAQGVVYFGTQDGTVYALDGNTGATRWTYKAAGSVKGSPALDNGVIYFGDYGGDVHAVSAATGRKIWSVNTSGAILGSGTFYAAPAVAYGRVYIGNTDGHMYSFSARTGQLAWAYQTGNYVYASAAVTTTPGLGPTVYVGSYDGTEYAFDADTGHLRWKYVQGGKISGSATIVGNILYFANLGKYDTTGLDITTGRPVFHYGSGAFDPVISDGKRIYLTGYNEINALDPVGRPSTPSTGQR